MSSGTPNLDEILSRGRDSHERRPPPTLDDIINVMFFGTMMLGTLCMLLLLGFILFKLFSGQCFV